MNHDLRACVRAEPRNKVGEGDKLATTRIRRANGEQKIECADLRRPLRGELALRSVVHGVAADVERNGEDALSDVANNGEKAGRGC